MFRQGEGIQLNQQVQTLENTLTVAVHRALSEKIEQIKQEIISEAEKEFHTRVQKAVGEVAIQLSDYFSVEKMAGELLIRVQIDKLK